MQLSYRVVLAVAAARLGLLGELGAKFSHTKKSSSFFMITKESISCAPCLLPMPRSRRLAGSGSLHLEE